MAETSRGVGRWLRMTMLWTAALAGVGETLADDPPKDQPKPMFQAPKGWRMKRRSEGVLFFDLPGPKDGAGCRIAVMEPMEARGSFEDWFQLVQAPDPVVSESKITVGKSKGGYATLRQTRVVRQSRGNLHRHYCGLDVGKRYALILYSSSSEELFNKHLKEVQAVVDTWDASGRFPTGREQEKK
jgi:hypothetical protein